VYPDIVSSGHILIILSTVDKLFYPTKKTSMSIRRLQQEDIPLVKDLPPEEWKFNYRQFLNLHFGKPYFYAVVYVYKGKIAGTGNAIINGRIGWLANIITSNEYRNQGIGTSITKHLMEYIADKNCETQLLIATDLGHPIYQKLGFRKNSTYRFFRSETPLKAPEDKHLVKLKKTDLKDILEIDRQVLGDDRAYLITRCYQGGWIYKENNRLIGYYLPNMGRGAIVATEKEAGLLLLQQKHSQADRQTAIPKENQVAFNYLFNNGFEYFNNCARMIIGKEVPWQPTNIFSYSHGYCG
jgi:GNAT superfamily N-acetyltransferase